MSEGALTENVKSSGEYDLARSIIVEKSTIPVRTAEKIRRILAYNKQCHFEILSNPEFMAEGTAMQDLKNPDRILIGGENTDSGKAAIKKLSEIYEINQ